MKNFSNYHSGNGSGILKLLMIMKLTLLLFFLPLLSISATSYSQGEKISLELKGVSLKEVLKQIEEQSSYRFIYKDDLVRDEVAYSLDFKKENVDNILNQIFNESNVDFSILEDNLVVLVPKGIFKKQAITIKGTVNDLEGIPLPGVNVVEKGTANGAVTDLDGNYTIEVSSPNAILSFSYVGYLTEDVTVGEQTNIDVTLVEDIQTLDEVVVVGYGSVKKVDLTGSIATVSGDDLHKNAVVDPIYALQGKAAGISITPKSGQPGADVQVVIRGVQSLNASNSPIYVIDGIISESMGHINTNDIESISVLKDASSTAIYGSRAANGVVIISTKRGEKGAPVISFHTYQGIRTTSNLKPELLGSRDYLHLLEESYANSGQEVPNTSDLVNQYYLDGSGNIIDTDWLDVVMRKGKLQYYDLSVSGGSEKSNYFISTNYLDEKGLVIGQGQSKLSFRFNSDHKLGKYLDFGNTLSVYNNKNEGLPGLSYVNYPNTPNPYMGALRKTPLTRPYEDDGNYGYTRYEGIEYRYIPPHVVANEYERNAEYNGLQGNIFLKIKPLKGLTFTPRVSLSYNFTNSHSFTPTVHIAGTESIDVNKLAKYTSRRMHWQTDYLLEYEKTFLDKHNLKALAVYSQEEQWNDYLEGSRDDSPLNSVTYLNAGDPSTSSNGNGYSDWSFVSYLGRLNYDFEGKYLIQGTIRYDGSSRFSEENRWGTFPSFSLGWRISEEKFFQNLTNVVNNLKFRASVGTVGNSNIGNYPTYSALSATTYVLNETVVPAYRFQSAINSDIKWEKTIKKDFGLDAALFESKLIFSANYFVANTTDLLFSKPLPLSSGKSGGIYVNGGEVMNKGVEFELGYRQTTGDFSYSINVNAVHQKNEVVDLMGEDLTSSGLEVGKPAFSYYGYSTNGIIKTEADLAQAPTKGSGLGLGDIWFLDITDDGAVTEADRAIIGSKYPDFSYGIVTDFSYKRISLAIQMQGVHGFDLPYTVGNYFQGNPENNLALIMERWHPTENPGGDMPIIKTADVIGNTSGDSDFWLTDASYFRINNITLSYSIPSSDLFGLIKNAQVYVTGQNLYTLTRSDYRGVEVDMSYTPGYYDGNPSWKMPLPRTMLMGVKLSF